MQEQFALNNAGIILAAPFFPHLWSQLHMLVPDGDGQLQWIDEPAMLRAPQILQYLATGNSHLQENALALNMALCGIQPGANPVPETRLTSRETEVCDSLIQTVLAQWTSIGLASPDTLRNTFLQRSGKLELDENAFRLTVERKAADVLIDHIPWGFSTIFHPWMAMPIMTHW